MAFSGPRMKLRANVRIPARVVSGPGISQEIANGVLTTGLDLTDLEVPASIPNPSIYQIPIYNEGLDTWEKTPLSNVPTTTTGDGRTARGDADYTILNTDRYIGLTAALTAPRTWSLPAANSVPAGTRLAINDEAGGISSTNTLTLGVTGADTINGASTFVLNAARSGVTFRSDGTSKWSFALATTAQLPDDILSADTAGRGKMADGFAVPAKLAAAVKAATSPINLGVSATASAGALTINLLDAAGSTPAALSPVILPFRSATAAAGTTAIREVSAATSLVVSSGSTLGVPAINTAFALWLVAFDDGGTVRLGIINAVLGGIIYQLGRSVKVASSTAEGGSGGADSAQVFYTGTAVTSKAYTVLARMAWESGLSTLGTWTAPTTIEVWHPGMKMPGDVVQKLTGLDSTPISASSTTKVGTSTGITIAPTSACNMINVRVTGQLRTTSAAYLAQAQISRGGTFSGVGSTGAVFSTGSPTDGTVTLEAFDFPNTASSTLYVVFVWGSGAAASAFIWLPNAIATSNAVMSATEIQV